MKKLLLISILVITVDLSAQGKTDPTNQFTIEGKVKKQLSYSLKDLTTFAPKLIHNVVIYNHLMERKKTIRLIKGVLLKDIIDKAVIDVTRKL